MSKWVDPNLEEDKIKYTGRWSANYFQGETSLVRVDFKHGKQSFGWDGPMKIILSDADGYQKERTPYHKLVQEEIWELAMRLAAKLNKIEKNKASFKPDCKAVP